jgi:hypothetical protein
LAISILIAKMFRNDACHSAFYNERPLVERDGCNAFDFIPMQQELRLLRGQQKGDHEGLEKTAPFGKPPALYFASEVT